MPARWGYHRRERPYGTSDGCVPVRVAWAYFGTLTMGRAVDALGTARGIGLALGADESGTRARIEAFDDAYPREVTDG